MRPASGRVAASFTATPVPRLRPSATIRLGVDVRSRNDRVEYDLCVGDERRFARRAFARAVAAVIDRDDRPVTRPARVGERSRDFLRVAAEIQDGRCRQSVRGAHPAAQPRAIGGGDLERLRLRASGKRSKRWAAERRSAVPARATPQRARRAGRLREGSIHSIDCRLAPRTAAKWRIESGPGWIRTSDQRIMSPQLAALI